jgi:hypothetical protein
LLEGEGCFMTKTGTKMPVVAVHMTDKDVLDRLASIFDAPIFEMRKQAEHHKSSWKWQATGRRVAEVMRSVRPLMSVRRGVAIDSALMIWDEWQAELTRRAENGRRAAQYYLGMEKPSLRKAGVKYGVCYETVRDHVAILRSA